jgi:hypothetical protein
VENSRCHCLHSFDTRDDAKRTEHKSKDPPKKPPNVKRKVSDNKTASSTRKTKPPESHPKPKVQAIDTTKPKISAMDKFSKMLRENDPLLKDYYHNTLNTLTHCYQSKKCHYYILMA